MKSPREVLEKLLNNEFDYKDNVLQPVGYNIDHALSDLTEIVRGMERVNRNCSTCDEGRYCDGCVDNGYNQAVSDIAKLFEEQTKKGER